MDSKNSRNSIKLTETLSELEAALKAWDSDTGGDAANGIDACGTGLSDERRKRAQELLEELKSQIARLSDL